MEWSGVEWNGALGSESVAARCRDELLLLACVLLPLPSTLVLPCRCVRGEDNSCLSVYASTLLVSFAHSSHIVRRVMRYALASVHTPLV